MINRKNKIAEEKTRIHIPNWRQQPHIQFSAQTATDLSSTDRSRRCIDQSAVGWPASALQHMLVQPDPTGTGSIEVTQFPPLRQGSILHLNAPNSEGLQLFPTKTLTEWSEPLACPYQAASLLPSYHSSSSSSTEATNNPTPFKPVVYSSYPNTGELNLLLTQHTCSRTPCAQSTEKSLN